MPRTVAAILSCWWAVARQGVALLLPRGEQSLRIRGERVRWKVQSSPVASLPCTGTGRCADIAAITLTGEWFVTGGADATACVWSLRDLGAIGPVACLMHESAVTGVATCLDGEEDQIVTAAANSIRLWGPPTFPATNAAHMVRCSMQQQSQITSVAAFDDGHAIISGNALGSLFVWDMTQGCPKDPSMQFGERSLGQVNSIVVLGSTQLFASGHENGFVLLWSLADATLTRKPLKRYYHGQHVLAVAVNPQSTFLYSGGMDGRVGMWDLSVDDYSMFVSHGRPVTSLRFSADGDWLFTSSADGEVKVWDDTGIQVVWASTFVHDGPMSAMSVSPDGLYLVTSDGGDRPSYKALVWDLRLRASSNRASWLHTEAIGNVTDLAFFPNSARLASGHADGSVCVWNLLARKQAPSLYLNLRDHMASHLVFDRLEALITTEDGQHILAQLGNNEAKEAYLVRLDGPELRAKWVLRDPPPWICQLKAIPGGKRFASCSLTGADVWDMWDTGGNYTAEPWAQFDSPGDVYALAASPDARWLIIGSTHGMTLKSLSGRDLLGDLESDFTACGHVVNLAVDTLGEYVVSGVAGGMLCVWNLRTLDKKPQIILHQTNGDVPHSATFARNVLGELILLSGGRHGFVSLWELTDFSASNKDPYMKVYLPGDQALVRASADGTIMYTGTSDGQVKEWYIYNTAEYVRIFKSLPACQAPSRCTLSVVRVAASSGSSLAMPTWLDATPLRYLDLSGSRIAQMSPTPPWSLIGANLSRVWVKDWSVMGTDWFVRPRWIDLREADHPVLPSITGLAPVRRVGHLACRSQDVCLVRAPQQEGQLCAHAFITRGMYQGRTLVSNTTTLIDWQKKPFRGWLCNCPAGFFGVDGSRCALCPVNAFCPSAGLDVYAKNAKAVSCPAGSGNLVSGSERAEQCKCNAGYFSETGHVNSFHRDSSCRRCPSGRYNSHEGSTECMTCHFGVSIEDGEVMCALNRALITFIVVLALAILFSAWAAGRQIFGISIEDVRREDDTIVVTTCGRHWISELHFPQKVKVVLNGTGHPRMDGKLFRAKCLLGGYRFELLDTHGFRLQDRVDASRGVIMPAFPFTFLFSGRPVPACVGVPGLIASLACCARYVDLRKRYLLWALGGAIVIAFVLRLCGIGMRRSPQIKRRLAEYRGKVLGRNPDPRPCESGPGRAVTAFQLNELYEHFKSFINDRDMYYIASAIIKPMTQSHRLSFAEFVGPSSVQFFVSHFWGTPFQHFVASVVKHAQQSVKQMSMRQNDGLDVPAMVAMSARSTTVSAADLHDLKYWICSLSNNQWKVKEELGNGDWSRSSFYKALTSDSCKATVMVIDEDALPLTRAWCLFEVLQTFIKSKRCPGSFSGLLLATPSGVLNYPGSASVDAAMAVAERLAFIRMQDAEASDESDKQMISDLVMAYEGGFETMNRFIRNSIRDALMVIKSHHNEQFERLVELLLAREEGPGKFRGRGSLVPPLAVPTQLPSPSAPTNPLIVHIPTSMHRGSADDDDGSTSMSETEEDDEDHGASTMFGSEGLLAWFAGFGSEASQGRSATFESSAAGWLTIPFYHRVHRHGRGRSDP